MNELASTRTPPLQGPGPRLGPYEQWLIAHPRISSIYRQYYLTRRIVVSNPPWILMFSVVVGVPIWVVHRREKIKSKEYILGKNRIHRESPILNVLKGLGKCYLVAFVLGALFATLIYALGSDEFGYVDSEVQLPLWMDIGGMIFGLSIWGFVFFLLILPIYAVGKGIAYYNSPEKKRKRILQRHPLSGP